MSNEIFDGLTETATSEREMALITDYITSEKIKTWLTSSKEGQAISQRLMIIYEKAHDDFENCEVGDIEALTTAKMELEVAKRLYGVFNSITQEGDIAEMKLSGEIEQ